MGGSEEGKLPKSEKSSPSAPAPAPATEQQTNVHVYPEWAAMQAYYGSRVAMPPYYNPAVASGQPPPPYMWGPQPMIPPYGTPYATIYAPGGVYAHPVVPLGTPTSGQGASSPVVSESLVATPLSIDMPVKASGNADKGLMKKLKGFDGLVMSIGNGNGYANANANAKIEGSAENKFSQSADTEGSSDGSIENTEEADKHKRKRRREGAQSNGEDEQVESKAPRPVTDKVSGTPITLAVAGTMGTVAPPSVSTALDLLNPANNVKGNSTTVSSSNTAMSSDVWIQNERELKREKRKQSNRESARRSRLRRQAEAEELGKKVDSLTAENVALKSEINQLVDNSKKLCLENATLLEKFQSLQPVEEDNTVDVKRNPTDSTENLLSRVNNSTPVSRSSEEDIEMYEKGSNSKGSKFHQLLSASPRTDTVVAG